MSNVINILNANEAGMFNSSSFAASTLSPREESTSAVATRSLQRESLSASQTTPRHIVHLTDGKKSGDMGACLAIIIVFSFLAFFMVCLMLAQELDPQKRFLGFISFR